MRRYSVPLLTFVLVCSVAWATAPGHAQRRLSAYDADLMRLAEILGSVHYLRDICGAQEGQLWRRKMEKLIATERSDPQQKRRMVAHFNHGYRSFSEIYRSCTQAAAGVANRYVEEGARLTRKLLSAPES
jgi:uncharacterized protein (TIGR02301 family)